MRNRQLAWLVSAAALFAGSTAFAQTATDAHTFTIAADNAATLDITGTTTDLRLTAVPSGGTVSYTPDTDTLTTASFQVLAGSNYVIQASLNLAIPAGAQLTTQLTTLGAGCGSSAAAVPLTAVDADIVTGITSNAACTSTVQYVLSQTGTLDDTLLGTGVSRTVTYTLEPAP